MYKYGLHRTDRSALEAHIRRLAATVNDLGERMDERKARIEGKPVTGRRDLVHDRLALLRRRLAARLHDAERQLGFLTLERAR